MKYNDLKFKVLGRDRFESKNNYCDHNIQNSLKFFSPAGGANDNQEAVKIRKILWRNQQLLKIREAKRIKKVGKANE